MKEEDIDILIYSGGKTASSTFSHSFKNITSSVFHTHGDYFTKTQLNSDLTIKGIINAKRNKKLLIISCYREPISRHLSTIFEAGIFFFGLTNIDEINDLNNDIIRDKFIEFLNEGTMNYHPHSEYFVLNEYIDILEYPFNREQGFQIYETTLFKWIYFRFDKLKNAEQIIRDNTEYKNFKLLNNNTSSEKEYSDKYQKFKKNVQLPNELLDLCFERDLKNLQYFYTDDEIKNIKDAWYNNAVSRVNL